MGLDDHDNQSENQRIGRLEFVSSGPVARSEKRKQEQQSDGYLESIFVSRSTI